jgi:hypothetical protein
MGALTRSRTAIGPEDAVDGSNNGDGYPNN